MKAMSNRQHQNQNKELLQRNYHILQSPFNALNFCTQQQHISSADRCIIIFCLYTVLPTHQKRERERERETGAAAEKKERPEAEPRGGGRQLKMKENRGEALLNILILPFLTCL